MKNSIYSIFGLQPYIGTPAYGAYIPPIPWYYEIDYHTY